MITITIDIRYLSTMSLKSTTLNEYNLETLYIYISTRWVFFVWGGFEDLKII